MKHSYNLLWVFLLGLGLSSCIFIEDEHVAIDERDAFVGRFDVEEYSETNWKTTQYSASINKSSHERDVVWVSNFYGIGIDVYGIVDGTRIRVPSQRIGDYETEGQGYVDEFGDIRLFFTLIEHRLFSDRVDNCEAIFSVR